MSEEFSSRFTRLGDLAAMLLGPRELACRQFTYPGKSLEYYYFPLPKDHAAFLWTKKAVLLIKGFSLTGEPIVLDTVAGRHGDLSIDVGRKTYSEPMLYKLMTKQVRRQVRLGRKNKGVPCLETEYVDNPDKVRDYLGSFHWYLHTKTGNRYRYYGVVYPLSDVSSFPVERTFGAHDSENQANRVLVLMGDEGLAYSTDMNPYLFENTEPKALYERDGVFWLRSTKDWTAKVNIRGTWVERFQAVKGS